MGNNKKKIGIIVAIVVVILAIIGILAFLYFVTDTFKTPQQLFYSYLQQNEEMLKGLNVSDSIVDTKKMLKDQSYTTNGILTIGYKNELQSEINTMKLLILEGKTDEIEAQAYSKIKLLNPLNQEELFNVEYLRTNDLYALTSNQVVNLYLAVQNNNLKSFIKKIGVQDVSQIPNKIETVNIEETLINSQEQLKNIFNKYGNLLIEQIPSEKYAKQKNVSLTINEKNYEKLEIYTLTLTQKEVASVLRPVLQTLKDDDETLNTFLELYKTNKTIDDLNELKNQIQKIITKVDTIQLTDDISIQIDLYVKDKKLIKTQLQLGNGIDEGALIEVIPILTEQETKIVLNVTNVKNEEEKFTVTLAVNKTEGIKIAFNAGQATINLGYVEQAKDQNTITKLISAIYTENENIVQISFNEEKVITQNLDIDKLDSNTNCVILNDYPQEALQLLMTQIGERLGQIFNEIGNEIGITTYIQGMQFNDATEEKEIFNEQFTTSEVANVSGENVKKLLNKIINSNKSQNKKVSVKINNSATATSEENELNTIISQIQQTSQYNVAFEYSEEGYINLVTITQN